MQSPARRVMQRRPTPCSPWLIPLHLQSRRPRLAEFLSVLFFLFFLFHVSQSMLRSPERLPEKRERPLLRQAQISLRSPLPKRLSVPQTEIAPHIDTITVWNVVRHHRNPRLRNVAEFLFARCTACASAILCKEIIWMVVGGFTVSEVLGVQTSTDSKATDRESKR